MPYSGPNDTKIPSHVPAGKRAQWVRVWNSTFAACQKAGGEDCEGRSFRAANGVIKKRAQESRESDRRMGTHILAERIELLENTLNADDKTVGVVLIRPGWSANGRYYSRDVLAKAAPLFEGVKAYANHPTREQLKRGEGRSVLDITGDYTNVHIGEGGELRATRHVYGKAGEAVWPLIERAVTTQRPVIGVSINALGKAGKGSAEGRDGVIVESIEIANSADDVDAPAAGGKFESLLMSDNGLITDLLQALTYEEFMEARPDYVDTLKKQLKRARQDETVRALMEERDAAQAALKERTTERDELARELEAARADNARLHEGIALEKALREANFNKEYEALLRKRLVNVTAGEWMGIISEERAKLRAAGIKPAPVPVQGVPLRESRVSGGTVESETIDMSVFDTPEKLQQELNRRAAMRK